MTRDQELWLVALAIERQYGDRADLHVASQLERMIKLGDDAGPSKLRKVTCLENRLDH